MVQDRVLRGRASVCIFPGGLLGEVLAGAEGLVPSTGDDRDKEGRFFVEPGEQCVGVPVRIGRDGVALVGAVDGDQQRMRLGERKEEMRTGGRVRHGVFGVLTKRTVYSL